ncbi:MAG TPA: hypothetical protein VM031_01690 [Phycisphaerae bacterium]|nr:hypothetical protein [Phycisphaerae bacterium]
MHTAALFVLAAFLPGQAAGPGKADPGLLHLVPPEAVLVVERRGHAAVREAFLASNLGKFATDEAINEMVHASRKQFGKIVILHTLFPRAEPEQIEAYHKLLHGALRPFWHNPAAVFVVGSPFSRETPSVGAYCVPGKYRGECKDSLEALMKLGLPEKGQKGTRQAFTYRSGSTLWQGVAKGYGPFELPQEPEKLVEALKNKTLFMVSWSHPVLCVATGLPVADAIGRALPPARSKAKPLGANEDLQLVLAKTRIEDWAFRWYLDANALVRPALKGMTRRAKEPLRLMGLDRLRGLGGSGGYADKVFTRKTYVCSPGVSTGPLSALKAGGSYKKALAMVPGESTFLLAGEIDAPAIQKALGKLLAAVRPPRRRGGKPATAPDADDKIERLKKQLDKLLANLGGNVGLFVTDLQSLVAGRMGQAGLPVGAVVDVKDRAKAAEALDELIKLAGIESPHDDDSEARFEAPPDGPDKPAALGTYRKTRIRRVTSHVRVAILKDRIVFALGDNAVKAAIDVALDGTGGFEDGSPAARLVGLCGDGSAVFLMDLKAIAKLGWPVLMQMAEGFGPRFPFASLVSANKIARMLGPEVAVLRRDGTGLLMTSRGMIPFSTKFPLILLPQFVFAAFAPHF